MLFTLDTEFIDTPTHSELISLAVVSGTGYRYFEFDYPEKALTPWLREHVVPQLTQDKTTFGDAAAELRSFIPARGPIEFWALCGGYDWYWLCRLFGGFMNLPETWPLAFHELGFYTTSVPVLAGFMPHHALHDAQAAFECVVLLQKQKRIVRPVQVSFGVR